MKKLSIRFHIDKRAIDAFNMGNLLCRVRLDREDVNMYSVGVRVFVPDWDVEKQRCQGKSMEAPMVNTELSKFELKIREAYNRCMLAGTFEVADLKQAIAGDGSYEGKDTLLIYLDKHSEYLSKGSRLSGSTQDVYRATYKMLRFFLRTEEGKEYANKPAHKLGFNFTKKFIEYMRTTRRLAWSSTNLYVGKLQAIGEWMIEVGACERQPFPKPKTKVPTPPKRYDLKYEEWIRFEQYRPQGIAELDVYMVCRLQAFTGLSIVDALQLMWSEVHDIEGVKIIMRHRQKNYRAGTPVGRVTMVPVLDQAQEVLDWMRKRSPYQMVVCPRVSDDTINRKLAQFCKELDIPKLTSHDMRKIFTNFICKRAGLTGSALSSSLGHSSSATTEKFYLKDDIGQILGEFLKVQQFLNKAL